MDLVISEEPLLCRVCLQETSNLHDLSEPWSVEESDLTFYIVLSELTGLQIVPEEDGMPRHLCGGCRELARACYCFRKLCQKSHRFLARKHHTKYITDTSSAISEESDAREHKLIGKVSEETVKVKVTTKKKRTNKRILKGTNKACEQLYGDALWRPVACSECAVTAENVPTLIEHRATHHTARFQCLQCGGGLTTSRGLRLHQRRHSGARPEVCCTCGATFSDPRTRIIHEKRHAGTLRHVCSTCGRAFPARRPLERHRAAQHPHHPAS